MSPTENGLPDWERHRKSLEKLAADRAKQRAEEDAMLMPPEQLRRFRGHHCINQSDLAEQLTQQCGRLYTYTQSDVSQMERGKKPNRDLQLEASKYFRSRGYEADKAGDSIHIQPSPVT